MANLGSDNTPIEGESFGLPSGYSFDEEGGDLVIRDTDGTVAMRRADGTWELESDLALNENDISGVGAFDSESVKAGVLDSEVQNTASGYRHYFSERSPETFSDSERLVYTIEIPSERTSWGTLELKFHGQVSGSTSISFTAIKKDFRFAWQSNDIVTNLTDTRWVADINPDNVTLENADENSFELHISEPDFNVSRYVTEIAISNPRDSETAVISKRIEEV